MFRSKFWRISLHLKCLPKNFLPLKRKSWLCLSSCSVTTTTKYLLVKDEEVVYFWACITTVRPRTSSFVRQSARKPCNFFQPFIYIRSLRLKSQLQRAVVFNWMKDELKEGIFVDPVDCRTKVCTHMCKKDGPSLRAKTYETHCKFSVFSLISVSCHFSCQCLVTIFLWNHNVQFYTFVIWQVFPTSWHLNPVLS